jgi:transposase
VSCSAITTQVKESSDHNKEPRRNHGAVFKAKVALETIKEEQTSVELRAHFQVQPNQIGEWKKKLLDRASEIFDRERKSPGPDVKELHVKIGRLAMENDLLHPLPITKQGRILGQLRSGICYIPLLINDWDRQLMNMIDRIHLEEPYRCTRGIRDALWTEAIK